MTDKSVDSGHAWRRTTYPLRPTVRSPRALPELTGAAGAASGRRVAASLDRTRTLARVTDTGPLQCRVGNGSPGRLSITDRFAKIVYCSGR